MLDICITFIQMEEAERANAPIYSVSLSTYQPVSALQHLLKFSWKFILAIRAETVIMSREKLLLLYPWHPLFEGNKLRKPFRKDKNTINRL